MYRHKISDIYNLMKPLDPLIGQMPIDIEKLREKEDLSCSKKEQRAGIVDNKEKEQERGAE